MTRPTSYRLSRSLAAGTAALALVALAGCGSDDDSAATASDTSSTSASPSPSPAESSSSSEAPSDAASDASDAPEAGSKISAGQLASVVQRALDEATTANVQVQSGSAMDLKGQVDFTTDPPAAQMNGNITGAGAIDTVLLDNIIYVKSKLFGTGDKWIKLDLDDPNSPLGALGDQLDPTSSLKNLLDGIKSATFTGEEDVDGETLDHYTAVIDTKALLKGLPAEAAGAAGLPATVDYQLWFDADGLIRKFSVDLGATGASEGTFSDWGTEVDIKAPPASQVTSMPRM